MIGSDLYTPLPSRPVRRKRRMPAVVVSATAGVLLVVSGAAAYLRDDGARGEPFAVGSIGLRAAPIPALPSTPAAPAEPTAPTASVAQHEASADADSSAGPQVNIENGVTVIRARRPSGGSGPMSLKVPDPTPQKPAFKMPDPQLIETTASGQLPRIGRDGTRPASVYAAAPVPADGRPRIAILIGGMGLDRAATAEASRTLPAGVTFGFAPYGEALDDQVGHARAAGHEVVLQMPMEDFGRGDHAFPHMLKAEAGENASNLRWLMGRVVGYAGVGNYLGGRLLGDEASLKPILQDVAARGLYFIDDGTAPQSLAVPLAQDIGLPAMKADVILDASPDPAAIDAALHRLEQMARDHGFALGTAAGRQASNAEIGRYLIEAAKRGIVVVPVSQALSDASKAMGTADAKR